MRFETEQDLQNELAIIQKIANGNEFKKLGENDIDFEIEGKAYIEIKKFNYNHDQLKYYFVSLIKLVKMQDANKRLPTYFFIQFNDKLMYIALNDIEGHIKKNGRKERPGAKNDIELIVHVNSKLFKEFVPKD